MSRKVVVTKHPAPKFKTPASFQCELSGRGRQIGLTTAVSAPLPCRLALFAMPRGIKHATWPTEPSDPQQTR